MAKHSCIHQVVNGYSISISIDDNLCDGFRSELIVFTSLSGFSNEEILMERGSRGLERMAETIQEAIILCNSLKPGQITIGPDKIKDGPCKIVQTPDIE